MAQPRTVPLIIKLEADSGNKAVIASVKKDLAAEFTVTVPFVPDQASLRRLVEQAREAQRAIASAPIGNIPARGASLPNAPRTGGNRVPNIQQEEAAILRLATAEANLLVKQGESARAADVLGSALDKVTKGTVAQLNAEARLITIKAQATNAASKHEQALLREAQAQARLQQQKGDNTGAIKTLDDALTRVSNKNSLAALRTELQKVYLDTNYANSPLIGAINRINEGFTRFLPLLGPVGNEVKRVVGFAQAVGEAFGSSEKKATTAATSITSNISTANNALSTFARAKQAALSFFKEEGGSASATDFFLSLSQKAANAGERIRGTFASIRESVASALGRATGTSSPFTSLFSGGEKAAAQADAVTQALKPLNAESVAATSNLSSLAGVSGGAAIALGAVVLVVAALAVGFGLVVAGASAAFNGLKTFAEGGIEANRQVEKLNIGLASVINGVGAIKKDGIELTGAQKFNASLALATEQITKLKQEAQAVGLPVQDVAEGLQTTLAPLTAFGLTLDESRKTTLNIALAMNALNIPLREIGQESRGILQGDTSRQSRLNSILRITKEELAAAKERGTVAETLNERLAGFAAGGSAFAQSFEGAIARTQSRLSAFQGSVTEGLFNALRDKLNSVLDDIGKAGGIQALLGGVGDTLTRIYDTAGQTIGRVIDFTVNGIKQISAFLDQNKATVGEIIEAINQIVIITGEVIANIFQVIVGGQGANDKLQNMADILNIVVRVVGFIGDLIVQQVAFWKTVGGAIVGFIITPVEQLLRGLSFLAGFIPGIGDGFEKAHNAIKGIQKISFNASIEGAKQFKDALVNTGKSGEEAVKRIQAARERAASGQRATAQGAGKSPDTAGLTFGANKTLTDAQDKGKKTVSALEQASKAVAKLREEVASLEKGGGKLFELQLQKGDLEEAKRQLEEILKLRRLLSLNVREPLPIGKEAREAALRDLNREKSTREAILKLQDAQADAEAKLRIAQAATKAPVVSADVRSATAIAEAQTARLNATEQNIADTKTALAELTRLEEQREQVLAAAFIAQQKEALVARVAAEQAIINEQTRSRIIEEGSILRQRLESEANAARLKEANDAAETIARNEAQLAVGLIALEKDVALARSNQQLQRVKEERSTAVQILLIEEEIANLRRRDSATVQRVIQGDNLSTLQERAKLQRDLIVLQEQARQGFATDAFLRDEQDKAELARLNKAKSNAQQIIQLQQQIAHAGEDSAQRLQIAYLQANADIQEANQKAAEDLVKNQVKLQNALNVDPRRLNDGVVNLLASQKTLQQSLQDFRTNQVQSVFDGISEGVDKLTARFGAAGKAVNQFLKDLANLAASKLLERLFGVNRTGANAAAGSSSPLASLSNGLLPGGNAGGSSGSGGILNALFGPRAATANNAATVGGGSIGGGGPIPADSPLGKLGLDRIFGNQGGVPGGSLLQKIPLIGKLFSGSSGSLVGKVGPNIGNLPGGIQGINLPPLQGPGGAAPALGGFGGLAAGGLLAGGGILGSLVGGKSSTGRLLGGIGGTLGIGFLGSLGAFGSGVSAALPALLSNPFTAVLAGGLLGTALLLNLLGGRDLKKFKELVRGTYQVEVKGKEGDALFKSVTDFGKQVFGKNFKERMGELIRARRAKEMIAEYAIATGQDNKPFVKEYIATKTLTDESNPANQFVRRERGGALSAGQYAIVGERRPEVFAPNVGGKVFPSIAAFEQQMLAAVETSAVLGDTKRSVIDSLDNRQQQKRQQPGQIDSKPFSVATPESAAPSQADANRQAAAEREQVFIGLVSEMKEVLGRFRVVNGKQFLESTLTQEPGIVTNALNLDLNSGSRTAEEAKRRIGGRP